MDANINYGNSMHVWWERDASREKYVTQKL